MTHIDFIPYLQRIEEHLEQAIAVVGELRDKGVHLDAMPGPLYDLRFPMHKAHNNVRALRQTYEKETI